MKKNWPGKFAHIVSIAVLLLLLSGCAGPQQMFCVNNERKHWESEGWTYIETFGRPAEDTVMVAHGSFDTAQEATAFARTDGILTDRVYAQTRNNYLIVNMQRPNGDAFSLVFTKPKP